MQLIKLIQDKINNSTWPQ